MRSRHLRRCWHGPSRVRSEPTLRLTGITSRCPVRDGFTSGVSRSLAWPSIATAISTLLLLDSPLAIYDSRADAHGGQPLLLAGDPAVLDLVPAPRLRLDRTPQHGVINDFLLGCAILDSPIQMLYNDFASSILLFMILPLY